MPGDIHSSKIENRSKRASASMRADSAKQKHMRDPNPYENHLHEREARWFAVCTKYKREKLVLQRLQEQGIESYLPLQILTRRYTRKVRTVELPLISRYIFTRIVKRQYVSILETPDVSGFVRFSRNLLSIPDSEIRLLQRITGERLELTASPLAIHLGDEVEIAAGKLAGVRGILLEKENKYNFLVELKCIGTSLHIQINPALLVKVGKPMGSTEMSPARAAQNAAKPALLLQGH